MKKAWLALADGTLFEGRSFGADGEVSGEVVFNTSLTGYQEILTDPSYKGQMITMTNPHIGNYGVNEEDMESARTFAGGLIVREFSRYSSNWRSTGCLDEFLKARGMIAIDGIDTRALTQHIRDTGEQVGILSTTEHNSRRLVERAAATPGLPGRDLVQEVSCTSSYRWTEGSWQWGKGFADHPERRYRVVVYDFGIKYNILRLLADYGCELSVVPCHFPAEQVLDMQPDGVLLSNGPGDPAALPYAIENAQKILGKKPLMGICLGHQILGLALGGETYKLKFGHHGGNHPVQDLRTGEVKITTQNHGFAVRFTGIEPSSKARADTLFGGVEMTHLNLNDQTVEGLQCLDLPAFSIQYHPESSPGPHDARYLFRQFIEMMDSPPEAD